MVGVTGFEPATLCSQSICATKLRHTPMELVVRFERTWTFTSPGYKSGALDHYAIPAFFVVLPTRNFISLVEQEVSSFKSD